MIFCWRVERIDDVVDHALAELAGVGEQAVEGLDLLLQRVHDLTAVLTHRVQRQLEGIGRGVGCDGAEQLRQLFARDEREAAGEQIDAAAAGLEARRHQVDQIGVHQPVAGDHRAAAEDAATLPQMRGRVGDVDQAVEHRVEFVGEVGVRRQTDR